jgi:hypothetical protein
VEGAGPFGISIIYALRQGIQQQHSRMERVGAGVDVYIDFMKFTGTKVPDFGRYPKYLSKTKS